MDKVDEIIRMVDDLLVSEQQYFCQKLFEQFGDSILTNCSEEDLFSYLTDNDNEKLREFVDIHFIEEEVERRGLRSYLLSDIQIHELIEIFRNKDSVQLSVEIFTNSFPEKPYRVKMDDEIISGGKNERVTIIVAKGYGL